MSKKYFFLTCALIFIVTQAIAQPASFMPRGIGGGGALFFPRINPANDNEFYVSCDMSEMFHSTDYGNNYTQLHFSALQSFNVSTYEFTSNPLIAYSNYNDGNNGYPVKTTNGGVTWTMLPGYDGTQGQVYSMKANYNNPNQLLMDYYGKIVFSNDGGATFSTVANAISMGVGLIMGGAFYDGSNIYVGTNQGIYYSTTGGASFSLMTTTGITAGQVIWQFAGAKAGATTRFTCITGLTANIYNGLMPWDYSGIVAGVYTMDNAGGTWVNRTAGITTTNDYVMYVGMAENDINTIYLGGHDNALGAPLVYKSTTGGTAWSKVFSTTTNANIITGWEGSGGDKAWSWGETVFGMSVAPNNSSKAMFGSFSDVHLTSDGGTSWKQAYVKNSDQHAAGAATPTGRSYHSIGLENTTCWQVYWNSATNMIGCFSDIGGIRSVDSGNSWSYTCSGMSVNSLYRIAKTPLGTMFAGTSKIHDMYQSTRLKDAQLDAADASGNIYYSTNGGANWTMMHSFGHPVFWVAIDPNDSNKMYASVINANGTGSAGGIWMTTNLNMHVGSTWVHLANPPRTEGHPACLMVLNDGKVLCTYSGRINPSNVFTASSGVYLYDPGTSSWSDVSDVGMHYWTKDIVLDPADATQSTWYACVFTHWGGTAANQGGLYKTTNRGTSWTKLTGTTFDRVTSITFNPLNNNQAYLTTETQGLWISSNMNLPTPTWTQVSSYPFRQPERVYFNPFNTGEMWVSSFGNGMKIGSSATTGMPVFTNNSEALQVYPNPVKNMVHVVLRENSNLPISVYNTTGQMVARIIPDGYLDLNINTETWTPGLYMIYSGSSSAKFIKE
jgi:Secretion system C-terminal sorting domain